MLDNYVSTHRTLCEGFGNIADYVVAYPESIPVGYEGLLRDIGYYVVKNVYPNGSGIEIFKKIIR